MYMSMGNTVKLDLTNFKPEPPYPLGFRPQGENLTKDQGDKKQQYIYS